MHDCTGHICVINVCKCNEATFTTPRFSLKSKNTFFNHWTGLFQWLTIGCLKSLQNHFSVCFVCVRWFIQTVNQESQEVKLQLKTEQERASDLLNKLKELEVKAHPSFPFEPSGEQ